MAYLPSFDEVKTAIAEEKNRGNIVPIYRLVVIVHAFLLL
jgi:hypothetical protein